jgi:hypothetical protein
VSAAGPARPDPIGGKPARFVKVAGRWYLSIKDQMG